jgi:hypothetical protein
MILRLERLADAAPSPSVCAIRSDRALAVMFNGPLGMKGCHGIGRRTRAHSREEGRAFRGGVQKTTDRGPDKRPQGAARLSGCFCLVFSLIRQCAASGHNVRALFKTLLALAFPHIAEAGHG